MPTADVAQLREDYRRGRLEREDLLDDPIAQFASWIEGAIADQLPEPNAVVVATVDAHGRPDARVVLLKGFDVQGFVFYTNYESTKGQQLEAQPFATLVFNWLAHERQVRIRGRVERVSAAQTAQYFHSRPKSSQIGAWASPQSAVLPDRAILEQRQSDLEARFASAEALPVPEHWGGYRVLPDEIEFWQGRSSRLHDRFRFRQNPNASSWTIERLAP